VAATFSIIIPTRDRYDQIVTLLDSIKQLNGLDRIRPEIIVGDNGSQDQVWEHLQGVAAAFPVPLRSLKVKIPGKCRVLNAALHEANGDILAFLDDDIVVDVDWLVALEKYFGQSSVLVAQGPIRIARRDIIDPELCRLIDRYRTVRQLEFDESTDELHSLNGANMAIRRCVFKQIGNFDLRLGPGASGTSEDIELARRILQKRIKINYMTEAIVFHQVDRSRLTEDYFKSVHERQGRSRFLIKRQSAGRILFDLFRVSLQYGFYSLFGGERKRYRSKGRIYHYLGMIAAKRNGSSGLNPNEIL
jgi:glycosyltransferase involved in cell wall biosynthesis